MPPTPSGSPSSSIPAAKSVVFLLCGGLGTRLRGVTEAPKAVLEIAGWPMLRYHLERFRATPVERIVFLTGHGAVEVERLFGPPSAERIFVRESAPLGTGGALAAARAWAGEVNWVANGDSFVDLSPGELLEHHRKGTARIVTVEVEDRAEYGGVEIDAEDRITGFIEKGSGGPGWINAGLYLLDRALLDELPRGASSLEHDHFPRWAAEGRLLAHRSRAFFRDIGTPERLAAARKEFGPIRRRLASAGGGGVR